MCSKRLILIFSFLLFLIVLSGCTSTKKLEGDWNTVALIKDEIAQELLESNIEFENYGDFLAVNGYAGVNLYMAQVKVKGKNYTAYNLRNTGFYGTASAMDYENLFFTALMEATKYKIKDDVLYLYVPSQNLEMQLQKVK